MLTKDFKDLLRLLNANQVDYLLIGGHAFSVHAEPRATKDLDVGMEGRRAILPLAPAL